MSIPDFQSLMLPVLQHAASQEVRMPDIAQKIANDLSLTESDLEVMLPSGRQRLFYNRLAWAKFHMSKAGLIDTPSRGKFVATEAGRALLARHPARIDVALLRTMPDYATFMENVASSPIGNENAETGDAAAGSLSTPEEQIDSAHRVLESALQAELLQRILTQGPEFFEHVIVELLVAMGYGGTHERAALRLGRSGDGGVDGVIDEDRLGLDRIYIQAKRYAQHVGVGRPEVQAFVGSLVGLGATKGVFVTTSAFSSHAVDYVRYLPQRVILIDGARLTSLMVEHGVGVRINRTIAIKRIDEDFFTEE